MSDDRIIRGFGDRLAIEQAVRALAQAPNAFELERRARDLAAQGEAVIPALLRHLDTDDPTLRGGLGLLARHLDRDAVVPALRRAAADPRRPAAARLTAVMILERYLDEAVDPNLAGRLPDARAVARQSAHEALRLAETTPLVLVEYAEQLLREPPEVIHQVIDVLTEDDDPRMAELLGVIAAYAAPTEAARLIHRLGVLRTPAALLALATLQKLLAPELQPLAGRSLRKLQLAGVRPPDRPPLRALWSPLLGAQGQSLLWFIRPHTDDRAVLLVLVCHDRFGLLQIEAHPAVALDMVPPPAPRGGIHRLSLPGSPRPLLLAEIDPHLGLRLLDEALERVRERKVPWPGELVVFGSWLWDGATSAAALPEPPPAPAVPADAFTALFRHPAFSGWVWDVPDATRLLARELAAGTLTENGLAHRTMAQRLVEPEAAALLAERLRRQAQWLLLIGDQTTAAIALAACEGVLSQNPDHPFVRALAWRSLLTAAADRATQQALKLAQTGEPESAPNPSHASFDGRSGS
ncbi:MAG: hypothetical protein NZP34_00245 [Caldilineales bacterium]|nr:hypothetical protein [Caldilineales bacterium]